MSHPDASLSLGIELEKHWDTSMKHRSELMKHRDASMKHRGGGERLPSARESRGNAMMKLWITPEKLRTASVRL